VQVFTLAGVLAGDLFPKDLTAELRSMAVVPSSQVVLVCDAHKNVIFATNGCGHNPIVFSSTGYNHPYGITIDNRRGLVYVSNQDGDNVIRFPLSNPKATSVFGSKVGSPRGIAVDEQTGNVFVAGTTTSAVFVFNVNGNLIARIPMSDPIGVYVNGNSLYISNKASINAAIYSYSLSSFALNKTFASPDTHPTGMVVYGGRLYVLGQTNKALYYFGMDGSYKGRLMYFSADFPEQIVVKNCNW